MTQTPLLTGLAAVADRYDGVILDLWGVIHDGEKPYPEVIACLDALHAAGKSTCLLSNAPRRIGGVVAKLDGMGIGRDRYQHVMTSGEAAYEALRDRRNPGSNPGSDPGQGTVKGDRLYHIGPERDRDVYLGLDITVVDRPEDADFVLNTGIDDFDETLADYTPRLDACRAANLPMICANPDLVVMVGTKRVICAGSLAQYYEETGGTVAWHGKPYPSVYARCFDLLGVTDTSRVVAIGDSLRTDVAGAEAAGIDSILIGGGIHLAELGTEWGAPFTAAHLDSVCAAAGRRPTMAMPALRW